jgi:hypothetical protein
MDASRFGTMVNGTIGLILGFLLAVDPALAQEGDPVKGEAHFLESLLNRHQEAPADG